MRSRLSQESRAQPVLPFQQAAPDGYNQSRGWNGSASGIANGVLAQVPVGKILVESVSRISQTVLCCAVQFSAVRAVAVRAVGTLGPDQLHADHKRPCRQYVSGMPIKAQSDPLSWP